MDNDETYQINVRMDDLKENMNQRFDIFKEDLNEIKDYIKCQTNFCLDRKRVFDKRVSDLEHFKTKLLTIGTGLGLAIGIFVGKIVI